MVDNCFCDSYSFSSKLSSAHNAHRLTSSHPPSPLFFCTIQRKKRTKAQELVYCGIFTALIAVGAFIKVPVPVVPFTLQFLFTMLAGLLLRRLPSFFAQYKNGTPCRNRKERNKLRGRQTSHLPPYLIPPVEFQRQPHKSNCQPYIKDG